MKIHGLRIYPQSVEVIRGNGAPIFVHGSVSEDCSDFFYTFRPLASMLRGFLVANDFTPSMDDRGRLEDPIPGLRNEFGSSLVAVDLENQVVSLRGDGFESWGAMLNFCEGAFLPVFRDPPSVELKRLCWRRDVRLTSQNWPGELRAVMHMWDDIYWQFFTTDRSDLDILINKHAGDPKLEMYLVDFDREYPDPSNGELQPAKPQREN
jgi:hypothetical protein